MKLETIIWQILIFLLGSLTIYSINNYLKYKNYVEAKSARAECVIKAKNLGFESLYDMCNDIMLDTK